MLGPVLLLHMTLSSMVACGAVPVSGGSIFANGRHLWMCAGTRISAPPWSEEEAIRLETTFPVTVSETGTGGLLVGKAKSSSTTWSRWS